MYDFAEETPPDECFEADNISVRIVRRPSPYSWSLVVALRNGWYTGSSTTHCCFDAISGSLYCSRLDPQLGLA